jgi:hypothetical protein
MTMTMRFSLMRIARTLSAGAATALIAGVLIQAGPTAANEAVPGPGEVRLTVRLNERNVSFPSALEPVARKTITFETKEYAPTDEMRQGVAELKAALAALKPDASLIITAYASDDFIAYRRARAVRGELIERHQMDASRIIAAGRIAAEHTGGATVIDVNQVDPTKCTGCGPTPFRAIAYDSGTMRLVTVLPEMLAATAQPQAQKAEASAPVAAAPVVAPKPAPVAIPRAPVQQAAKPKETETKSGRIIAAPPAAVQPPQAIQRPVAQRIATPQPRAAAGGCPRPRIIIDDYYPGGPLVPCNGRLKGKDD